MAVAEEFMGYTVQKCFGRGDRKRRWRELGHVEREFLIFYFSFSLQYYFRPPFETR